VSFFQTPGNKQFFKIFELKNTDWIYLQNRRYKGERFLFLRQLITHRNLSSTFVCQRYAIEACLEDLSIQLVTYFNFSLEGVRNLKS